MEQTYYVKFSSLLASSLR